MARAEHRPVVAGVYSDPKLARHGGVRHERNRQADRGTKEPKKPVRSPRPFDLRASWRGLLAARFARAIDGLGCKELVVRSAQSTAEDGARPGTGRGAGFALAALAFLVAAFFLSPVALFAAAEEEADGYHTFTNKDGQAIEAKIVQVASDRKNMTIERRDGRSFAMQINVLSLDDQQIVKDWIKLNPVGSPVAKAELDVTFEKAESTIEREKDDYYRFTTKDVTYTITVRNKSRVDLVGVKLEYALLMTQGVEIYHDEISGKPETYSTSDDGVTLVVKGNEDLPATLPFNYAHNLVTKPIKSERVQGDGNTVYGEDRVVGVLARVLDSAGNVIGEFKSAETGMRDVTWP